MKPDKFSRRRLLGSILAALAGWLSPRLPRVDAAPHRAAHPVICGPHASRHVVRYDYDGNGRLVRATLRPATPADPPTAFTRGQVTTYTY